MFCRASAFLLLLIGAAGAPAHYLEINGHKENVHTVDNDLRNQMKSMMDDDDEDDLPSETDHQNGFLQMENGADADANTRYLADSAAGLSAALGDRWNGKQLEKDADQKTKAFLNGIASPKALSGLNRMMGAMAALR